MRGINGEDFVSGWREVASLHLLILVLFISSFFFFVLFIYFSFLIRYFEAFKLLLLVSRNLSFRWNLRNGGSRFVAVMVSERSGFW